MSVKQPLRGVAVLMAWALASAVPPARAQDAQQPAAPRPADWLYPVQDPLHVFPPPVIADLPLPADAGIAVPDDCKHVEAAWLPAPGEQVPELGLQEAIDRAVCHNPELRQNRAMVQGAGAALGQAKAAYWPTVSGSISRIEQAQSYDGPSLNDDRIYATSKNIAVGWRVFDFGQREHKVLSQGSLVQASLASLKAAVRKVVMDVAQQYFAMQNAASLVVARSRNLQLAERMLRSTLNRQAKGQADQSEVLQAKSAVARSNYELSISQGDADKARALLAYTTGLAGMAGATSQKGEPRFTVASSEADTILNEAGDQRERWAGTDAWLAAMQDSHPAIVAALAQVDAARHNLESVRGEGLPSIDASWNQYENGRPNQTLSAQSSLERTASITLRVPFFDGFAQTYKVRAAQAQLAQKEAELSGARAQVMKDALFMHTEAKAALSNLKAAQQLASTAQLATESLQRKYDQGAADLVQMSQSMSALTQARSELVKCWTEWQAARLKLVLNH